MTTLSTEQLQAIVDEFGHLIDQPYSEEFCWEADLGNMLTPLQFVEECDNSGAHNVRALVNNIARYADEAADHLADHIDQINAQRDPDQVVERDLSTLPDDILRNIAIAAQEELENIE